MTIQCPGNPITNSHPVYGYYHVTLLLPEHRKDIKYNKKINPQYKS